MKSRIAATIALMALAAAHAKGAPDYLVKVVPPEAPYTLIEAFGVNDLGHFEGVVASSEEFSYVFWSPTSDVVLLTPPSGSITDVVGINDSDVLAVNTTAGPYTWSFNGGWLGCLAVPGRDGDNRYNIDQ